MSSNTLVYGEPGTGKTDFCCQGDEVILILNLEDNETDKNNRLEALINKRHSDKMIERKHLSHTYLKNIKVGKIEKKAYQVDGINTLKAFISEIDKLLALTSCPYATICIDSATLLREYAHDLWCLEHGRLHAVNPGDWSEVNDIVRDKLQPLMMWAKQQGVSIVLTAQMKDDYTTIIKTENGKKVEESAKAGRIVNIKEWATYGVNTIIELIAEKDGAKKPTGKYFAYCEKSLAGSWSENITGKSLYDVLQEKGV